MFLRAGLIWRGGLSSQEETMPLCVFKLVDTFFFKFEKMYPFKQLINILCFLAGLKELYLNTVKALKERST